MGQYYNAVTKTKDGKITVYSMQDKRFRQTHDYRMYNGVKLMEHSWWGNPLCMTIISKFKNNPMHLAWIGDYAEPKEIEAAGFSKTVLDRNGRDYTEKEFDLSSMKYLLNHTKKEYVDLKEYYDISVDDGWCIFPVSLLCSIGNGRGGGDYWDEYPNADMCGHWAGDLIELSNDKPEYEKLDVYFKEVR